MGMWEEGGISLADEADTVASNYAFYRGSPNQICSTDHGQCINI